MIYDPHQLRTRRGLLDFACWTTGIHWRTRIGKEDINMKNVLTVSAVALAAVLAAGCTTTQYQQETTSRLSATETATAR
ncbi:MAG: hypothetical protein R6V43_06900, partial [Halopseudomonas sp.]